MVFPFQNLEETETGRRSIFESFLNQQNALLQGQFGRIPSFNQPVDPGFNAPRQPSPTSGDIPRFGGPGLTGGSPVTGLPNVGPQNLGGGFLRGQRNFLSGLFQPAFQNFLGTIGSQLESGQKPTTFQNFIQTQFDPQRELARATSAQTGTGTGRLIGGRTRNLFF